MLCYVLLFCVVLCYVLLYRIVSYCIVLYCVVLCCIVLHCIVLYRIISYYIVGPTRRLITHQATSWTQQLYKDKNARASTQTYHHPNPYTPLRENTVTDPMKICPFCSKGSPISDLFLHGDSIHLHIHCTNVHIQNTRTRSNTDISTAIKHLGALLSHAPYPHNLGVDPFRIFLGTLLHQYDDNTRCSHVHQCPPSGGEPYEHITLAPRTHRSITTATSEWNHLKPDLTETSPDFCAYSHGLVSTLPPANYSRATMNVIDHIYIGILPPTVHIKIDRFFSSFVQHQQRAHETAFPRSRTTPHIMSIWWDRAKTQPDLLKALKNLNPPNNMKLYNLVSKAWK